MAYTSELKMMHLIHKKICQKILGLKHGFSHSFMRKNGFRGTPVLEDRSNLIKYN